MSFLLKSKKFIPIPSPSEVSHFQVTTCKYELLWSVSSSSFCSWPKLNRTCSSSGCCYHFVSNAVSLWLGDHVFPLAAFIFITDWVEKTTIKNFKDKHYMEKLAKKIECYISYICQLCKIFSQFSPERGFYLISSENFLLCYFHSIMELQIPGSGWKLWIKSTQNNVKIILILIFGSSSQLHRTCRIFSMAHSEDYHGNYS